MGSLALSWALLRSLTHTCFGQLANKPAEASRPHMPCKIARSQENSLLVPVRSSSQPATYAMQDRKRNSLLVPVRSSSQPASELQPAGGRTSTLKSAGHTHAMQDRYRTGWLSCSKPRLCDTPWPHTRGLYRRSPSTLLLSFLNFELNNQPASSGASSTSQIGFNQSSQFNQSGEFSQSDRVQCNQFSSVSQPANQSA